MSTRPVQVSDVPEKCSVCNSDVIGVLFEANNGAKHIRAMCTKIDCHRMHSETGQRKFLYFKHTNSHNLSQPDLDHLHLHKSTFGLNLVPVSSTGKTPACSYKDCTRTFVEMHHIMPRGYLDDADNWPIVPLCIFHHDKWHATLTTGLVHKALSYNLIEYEEVVNFSDESFAALEDDVDFFYPWALRDAQEAKAICKFAETNFKYAQRHLKDAQKYLEMTYGGIIIRDDLWRN